jgi:hypothetical protein
VALIRTDVSEDRVASIFRVNECEQIQSEIVSSCIGGDSKSGFIFIYHFKFTNNLISEIEHTWGFIFSYNLALCTSLCSTNQVTPWCRVLEKP